MFRLTFLTLALVLPVAPFGCPPTENTEPPLSERGTIETVVEAPAEAGPGETVTLSATATPADGGGAVTYAWLQTGGPGVRIRNADAATAEFTAPSLDPALGSPQNVVVMVTTSDAAGNVGRATATIAVALDPDFSPYDFGGVTPGGAASGPTADAGATQSADPNETVTLDGSESRGSGLSYQWRQLSGPGVTLAGADAARATFTVPAFTPDGTDTQNSLTFELRVTDSSNRSATDRVVVRIRNPELSENRVRVETTFGNFVLELDAENAPLTVENFLEYVDDEFYDGTIFHRVIPGFVVQGGGFTPGLNQKDTRDPIPLEADNGLENDRGTVAMARTSDPNSATSQFYVNLVDNNALNSTGPGTGYTVFGTVIEGLDVVDQIATVQTGTVQGFNDVPLTDVIIRSIRRLTNAEATATP